MEKHNVSFFGQKVGMLLNSSSMTDKSIFIRMIKAKADGVWEKPTKDEGKVIALSLIEICSLNEVLEHLEQEWKTTHKRKSGVTTNISFKWAKDNQSLWINIGDYGKNLKAGELRFFSKLMAHLETEKVEFATHGKPKEGA